MPVTTREPVTGPRGAGLLRSRPLRRHGAPRGALHAAPPQTSTFRGTARPASNGSETHAEAQDACRSTGRRASLSNAAAAAALRSGFSSPKATARPPSAARARRTPHPPQRRGGRNAAWRGPGGRVVASWQAAAPREHKHSCALSRPAGAKGGGPGDVWGGQHPASLAFLLSLGACCPQPLSCSASAAAPLQINTRTRTHKHTRTRAHFFARAGRRQRPVGRAAPPRQSQRRASGCRPGCPRARGLLRGLLRGPPANSTA
jgi:hypothetical protein